MVCDCCHEREAVIFLEQMSAGGVKRKINMCSVCADSYGISSDPKSIESSIGRLFRDITAAAERLKAVNSRMCPVCGTSLGEIKKTSTVGCPECYAIFKNEIRTFLKSRGMQDVYRGTMPARLSSFHSVLNDRIVLKNKMDYAVANEDYEKAALYRDYLRALEKSSVANGENTSGLGEDKA